MRGRLKRLAKSVLGARAVYALVSHIGVSRAHGLRFYARWVAMLAAAWARDRLSRSAYPHVTPERAAATRRSDTVFVFGSGTSLNDLTPAEWERFSAHDTFAFNHFFRQRWIRVDFHLVHLGMMKTLRWRPWAEEVGRAFANSPFYAGTTYLLQEGFFAQFSNQLVGYRLLPRGARILRYRTARGYAMPTASWDEGLRHVWGTLDDVVNAAVLLGWKHIVLVGVDLYDSRYFFLPADRTLIADLKRGVAVASEITDRGVRPDEPHSTAQQGVVDLMAAWATHLESRGVSLSVYNPRSLLAEVLPVYGAERAGEAHAAG